ncbi:KDO2-lipid IV(A) lauroyltransferase [Sinobacterium caligoides]|uniref:KDO2-lipid IV(A) lauroyltransferase n=1 Tax=Sinobacterium caligoides TaxID=933926 RepID=A0A3N2DGU1_9GAMM|nr:lysophospholipid acyltransferase family protein [Sinobacterium caligoides]ROR99017.1 KDO2-lipid IV(A) lauroyltransferase [Sinobacterium caligoides]
MPDSTPDTPTLKARLVHGVLRAMGLLPLRLLRGIGTAAGYLMWRQQGRAYKVTQKNIELCFPELDQQQRQQLVRRSLEETAKVGAELAQVWAAPWQRTRDKIVEVEGQALFEEAIATGRGTVLLAPHLGNWEVLGLYLQDVTQMTVLYQPPKQAALEWVIKSSRERSGSVSVPTNKRGVLSLIKTLQNGGTTGILPDQQPDLSGGSFAPFFGVQALTVTLVDSLLRRNGCVAVMGYAKRVEGGYKIIFSAPDQDIYHEDRDQALAAMNRSVEACVRQCPEQYQWEYKRFNKQPEGQPRFYKGL